MLEREVIDAAVRFAKQGAAALIDRFTQPPAPQALPGNNRFTDVEVTLIGIEECNREYLELLLDDTMREVSPALLGDPVVIVFETNRAMEHIVLVQFKFRLECSAVDAQRDCDATFRAMVDGRSMLGYKFLIVGVI